MCVCVCVCVGTVRRFLEKYEDDIELVVFVVGPEYVSGLDSNWTAICDDVVTR